MSYTKHLHSTGHGVSPRGSCIEPCASVWAKQGKLNISTFPYFFQNTLWVLWAQEEPIVLCSQLHGSKLHILVALFRAAELSFNFQSMLSFLPYLKTQSKTRHPYFSFLHIKIKSTIVFGSKSWGWRQYSMAAEIQAKSKYTNNLLSVDIWKHMGRAENMRREMSLKVITSLWVMFNYIYTMHNL